MALTGTQTLDRINYLNVGLMVFSAVIAYFLPFELFLLAYGLLGPAHYLTEISWLHDRNYFTHGKRDYLWLCGFALFSTFYLRFGLQEWEQLFNPILIAFAASAAMAFAAHYALRLTLIFSSFLLAYSFSNSLTAVLFFGVFLPTLVHVFFFTWIFILYGALKAKSRSGFYSLGVLTLLGTLLLLAPPPSEYHLLPYVEQNINAFGSLHRYLSQVLGWDPQGTRVYSAMRFIAFAYTYHYLNWFSKTKVIEWHQIGRWRLWGIVVLYLVFISTYLYDYTLGLKTLALLSLGHVLLEFPLNMKSFQGVAQLSLGYGNGNRREETQAVALKAKKNTSTEKRDHARRA